MDTCRMRCVQGRLRLHRRWRPGAHPRCPTDGRACREAGGVPPDPHVWLADRKARLADGLAWPAAPHAAARSRKVASKTARCASTASPPMCRTASRNCSTCSRPFQRRPSGIYLDLLPRSMPLGFTDFSIHQASKSKRTITTNRSRRAESSLRKMVEASDTIDRHVLRPGPLRCRKRSDEPRAGHRGRGAGRTADGAYLGHGHRPHRPMASSSRPRGRARR